MTGRTERRAAAAVALSTAVYFAIIWKLDSVRSFISFDTYQHFYPNVLYLVDALRDGGRGLLWNPYQSAGVPFLGTLPNGVLYPGNLLFLLLPANHALLVLAVLHSTIGGVSAYALCRELGIGRLGASCGAVAFQLSTGSVDVITWAPMLGGTYAWLPASMLFCERTLRAPTSVNAIALAGSLSLALLAGFPQIVFFTYQLIALRVVWTMLRQRPISRWRGALLVGAGLALPPLLSAVQLFPGLETAGQSMRGQALSADEALGSGALTWTRFRTSFSLGRDLGNPFVLLPTLVAANGLLRSATRPAALFYAATGLLYFLLAFGNATPLYQLYVQLPLGALFRDPTRFLWVTSFCLAILTALGVDAIARSGAEGSRVARHGAWVIPLSLLLGFSVLDLQGLSGLCWILGLALVGAVSVAFLTPAYRAASARMVAVLVAYGAMAFPLVLHGTMRWEWSLRAPPARGLLPEGNVMVSRAQFFGELRARMSAQDRAYFVHAHHDYSFVPKAASLFRIPTVQNYEPQPTRRAAEYSVMLLSGRIMKRIGEFYYPRTHPMPKLLRRRLLDMVGVRYIVADNTVDHTLSVMQPAPVLIAERDGLRVYESAQALPRARYVPQIEVVPDPHAQLLRLANGNDDLSRLALVENEPPAGFRGVAPYAGTGTVRFVRDEPEHLLIDVHASERGFLLLSDHYFSGWEAHVNGSSVPIQPANFLFRLIEIPAGRSHVELRYRPLSFRIGAGVSALTFAAVAIMLVAPSRMARRQTPMARRSIL